MRLLHTSDWHLGRSLHRADQAPAQEAFVDHLVEVVRAEGVDVVAVAGDVFDRAIPPLPAIALYEAALLRLRDAGARVVVSSGNHDSAARLGVNSALIDASGVHVRTRVADVAAPVVVGDAHGPVAIYAIPYLEPQTVAAELGVAASHAAVLGVATARAAADLRARGGRGVAVAHGWVTGGEPSESERDIAVGGVGSVPASLFEGFDYSALGHLHRPQRVGHALRYSGSPLPYAFSEAGQVKGSLLVTLDAAGLASVETVPAPLFRALRTLRGPLEELLTAATHAAAETAYVSAVLTDAVVPPGAMDRLRRRFPHVLQLRHEPTAAAGTDRSYAARLAGRSDREIAADFVAHVRGAGITPGEQVLLDDAFAGVRLGELANTPEDIEVA
jgi:exonuclease SbcD